MSRHHSGDIATRGLYLNLKTWEMNAIEEDGEQLPGPHGATLLKLPVVLVFLAGPFIGLLFIVLLPLLAPIVLVAAVAAHLHNRGRFARWMAMPAAPAQSPGLAYLEPKGETAIEQTSAVESPADDETTTTGAVTDPIGQLEQEIARRRGEGES